MNSVSQISSWMDPARDLTVEAAQAVGLSKALRSGTSSRSMPFAKLKALLDSRNDREILDGLRKVISMIYQNKPCLPYFSSVVKNVANPNIEVKKLVYIYLLHYAESDPDLALLSVNAIQKSLTDQNPQVRAMALRTMSGMRVPVISQIVSLAIKRGAGDMSPHVRKAAALAIPKCYRLDPNALPQLLEYLSTLLGDKQYFVVGPAVQAFLEICPERIDLIHNHYRSLIKKLVDMDEWGQLATLRLLLFYCRQCFPRRTQQVMQTKRKGFYDDDEDEIIETGEVVEALDPDLELLLKASRPLLQSRNAAVIIAVTSCFVYLGTEEHLKSALGPLVALMRGPPQTQETALTNIVVVALTRPKLFVPYASHFLIQSIDAPQIWHLKIEMLTLIFPHSALHLKSVILNELEHFSHSSDVTQIQVSVRAIGRCAQSDPRTSSRCFKVLLDQVESFDNILVSEVLTVMRHLIQQNPDAHTKTIIRLARNLDRTTSPEARATIIWLVGEYAGTRPENSIGPDVLRILAQNFAEESEEAKQQIVLLGAKVYLQHLQSLLIPDPDQTAVDPETGETTAPDKLSRSRSQNDSSQIPKIWTYILLLARYDTSYDLRDRARLLKALLSNPSSTQLASLLILAPKPVPHSPSPTESRKDLILGSTTLVLGKDLAGINGLPGYNELPDWVEEGKEPDPSLRDVGGTTEKEEYINLANRGLANTTTAASRRLDEAIKDQGLERVVRAGGSGVGSGGKKTLDDWLEESEEEDSEGETESETESGDEVTDSEGEKGESTEEESEDEGKSLIT